jgi:hypothetical protein
MDGFIFITKLTFCIPYAIPFDNIVFCSYGIMPDQPKPDLDLQGNFSFPQVFKRSINPIDAELLIKRSHTEMPPLVHFHRGLSDVELRLMEHRILSKPSIWICWSLGNILLKVNLQLTSAAAATVRSRSLQISNNFGKFSFRRVKPHQESPQKCVLLPTPLPFSYHWDTLICNISFHMEESFCFD